MGRISTVLFAGIVSASLIGPTVATAQSTDESQVRTLEDRFAAAVVAKDVDAIMKVYSPDVFVFDVIPPRQYVGAAAYREDWKGFLAGFSGPISFQISDLAVSADGTIAYGHSIQRVTGADPKGAKVDMTVRVTDVYRKQGGDWLIVQEHASAPIDLATGKADLMSKP